MFLGTVEPEFRSMLDEQSRKWDVPDVYVACSGHYTIERVLEGGKFDLHSNDVSVYSCALGWWLHGQDVPHTLKPEFADELGWLEPYLQGGTEKIATLMLCTQMLGSWGKDNLYHRRMFEAYRVQFSRLHDTTVAKLSRTTLKLESFSAMDAREYLDEVVPLDAAVVSFPPFFGTGAYEVMFQQLDRLFDWPKPEYGNLDKDGIADLIDKIRSRRHWMIGSNFRYDALEGDLRGHVQTGARRMPWYVYSSSEGSRVVRPRQTIEHVRQRRLGLGDEIGGRLSLAPLTPAQFNGLRSQYLDPTIAPAMPLFACAVLVDNDLIGAFGYSAPKYTPGQAYLMSDFAVGPSDYPRLSKLVLMAATSREAQLLAQRSMSRRLTTMLTTAFSKNPVSMKYRGLLELMKRGECNCDGTPHGYHLNYGGPLGKWTLAEALTEWKRKHGQRKETSAVG